MIKNILIQLQKPKYDWNSTFSNDLIELFKNTNNVIKFENDSIILGSTMLTPVTEIRLNKKSTFVSFNTDDQLNDEYQTKGLRFGFNIIDTFIGKSVERNFSMLEDNIGEYYELRIGESKYYQLTLHQLLERFRGKITEVNHMGINFSPSEINRKDYEKFKSQIVSECFLVKYPTGEEWPFIIPCNEGEYKNGIKDLEQNRNPKFEFVYSEWHSVPVIQLDIQCSLTKDEVFKLLPDPYGVSFEGLEDFIRTVFIMTDFEGVIVRFDIRFGKHSGKDFYPWMINEGGRIIK